MRHLLAAIAFAWFANAAAADSFAERAVLDGELCVSGTGVTDIDILVCTRALRAGGFSDVSRATLHSALGSAYRRKARPDKALQEHDAALRLNDASAVAWHERALDHLALGHLPRALQDLDRALALFPAFADAFRTRGRANFLAGAAAAAVSDLDRCIDLLPASGEAFAFRGFAHFELGYFDRAAADFLEAQVNGLEFPYLGIWRYLASQRANGGSADFAMATRGLRAGEWPSALVDVLSERRRANELFDELASADKARGPRRLYEARFYVAMMHLARGERTQAALLFDAVLRDAPPLALEHVVSRRVLKKDSAPPSSPKVSR